MIDTRLGAGYQILRSWRFQLHDGWTYEVIIVASTLLPLRPGPIAKRYVVAYRSPVARIPVGRADHVVGEYDDYAAAQEAAEAWIRDLRAPDTQ